MSSKAAATEYLVREFNALFASLKFHESIQLAAPGATWWVSGMKETNAYAGHHTFEERIRKIEEIESTPNSVINWAAYEQKIVELVVDEKGEKAVMEFVVQLREDDGEYKYKNKGVLMVETRDGKISKVREYLDSAPIAKYIKEKEEKGGKA